MSHEFEDVSREVDEIITEMEMDLEECRLEQEEAEESMALLKHIFGL